MTRIAALVVAIGVLAGCGGSGGSTDLAATDAWSRPTPTGAEDGVLYLTVTSDVDDELVAVEVPASVAAAVELHATTSGDGSGGHSHHGGGGGGEMSMAEVDGLEVPGGGSVTLEPGGHHAMLIGLAEPLVGGDTYPVTLRFASGRSVTTEAIVADNPPG